MKSANVRKEVVEPDDHFVWLCDHNGVEDLVSAGAGAKDGHDAADRHSEEFFYPLAAIQPLATGG